MTKHTKPVSPQKRDALNRLMIEARQRAMRVAQYPQADHQTERLLIRLADQVDELLEMVGVE